MFLNLIDILRIALVGVAFFFGYQAGFATDTYDPAAQLHIMTPLIILAIAGFSGIEGIFFGKKAAEIKGYTSDGNYQRQSAFALLSYAFIALMVYFLNWGTEAELTILFAFFFFFILSAINHAADAFKNKNYKWQNINRPFITLLMIAGFIYPLLKLLNP